MAEIQPGQLYLIIVEGKRIQVEAAALTAVGSLPSGGGPPPAPPSNLPLYPPPPSRTQDSEATAAPLAAERALAALVPEESRGVLEPPLTEASRGSVGDPSKEGPAPTPKAPSLRRDEAAEEADVRGPNAPPEISPREVTRGKSSENVDRRSRSPPPSDRKRSRSRER